MRQTVFSAESPAVPDRTLQSNHTGALDLAIVHLAFEGAQIFGGGNANVQWGHLGSLPVVKDELAKYDINITPYVFEIAYLPTHVRYSASNLRRARRQLESMGGELGFLTNYTEGTQPQGSWGVGELGGLENWRIAAAAGASAALNVATRHDAGFVYCHDSAYALAPIYASLQADAFGADILATYVVHASAMLHEMPLPNPERLMAESASMHWAKVQPRARLGAISNFMRDHVITNYGAHPDTIIPTGNGVNPRDHFFRIRDQDHIRAILSRHGIPLDRPLAATFGRAVKYKRHSMLLHALPHTATDVHSVVMAYPRDEELHSLRAELDVSATVLDSFDRELMACLIQWQHTAATVLPALGEPCGLIAMEARVLARESASVLVVSDTGGLVEHVIDGVDAFVTRQDDPRDLASTLDRIVNMNSDDREKMCAAGADNILDNYTWSTQIVRTLASCIPRVARVADEAIAGITRRERAEIGQLPDQ